MAIQYTLPAAEATAFEGRRSATDYEYQQNVIQNAAAQRRLGMEQATARRTLARQLDRARQQLPGAYSGRGLLRSGIYNRGIGDFEIGRVQAQATQDMDFGRRRDDLFSQLSSFDVNRVLSLANIDLQEAQRRSAIAAMLQGIS